MKQIPLLVLVVFGLSMCKLMDRFKKQGGSNSDSGTSSSSGDTGNEKFERPTPSAAETAALAGGQSAKWNDQGLSWTVPAKWTKSSDDKHSYGWGGGQTAFLNLNISVMGEDFPTDVSLKAFYDSAKSRMKNGELDQLRWLELDGMKGIQWRESKPDKGGDIRRLQWMAYRKYAGQSQLVNLILSADSDNFAKRQDEFYGILYSTKLQR